ncbi:MAG: transition state regulator Abh, partial [Eubacterium sp.]|nr:transition state regulator Abh [Eubacterium sp.]
MKNTGIVRRLDELGRITIPIELRRSLGIGDRESLEIYTEDN